MKTWLFYGNREIFNKWLFAEIQSAKIKSEKLGHNFSARINGTTDINPILFTNGGRNILETFPTVQFYDYSKVFNRLEGLKKYSNYHITFSYSETNGGEVKEALKLGYNVAVPFISGLPKTFLGHEVGDADETDLRFLDVKRIAGLKVKLIRDKAKMQYAIDQGFIVDATK